MVSCTYYALTMHFSTGPDASNILTFNSTAFNAALGPRTVSSMTQTKLASREKTIKKYQATAARSMNQRLVSWHRQNLYKVPPHCGGAISSVRAIVCEYITHIILREFHR
jgi:hypothetical protein